MGALVLQLQMGRPHTSSSSLPSLGSRVWLVSLMTFFSSEGLGMGTSL